MTFLSRRNRLFLFTLGLPAFAASPAHGIKNFYQVDAHVYRGAQPTDEGFQYLVKIGVGTVIDLREADERSQAEERLVRAAGMKYVNVPMTGLTPPTDAEINRILGILESNGSGAVFVHCKRGADRTGAVIAAYRIDHDHWDNGRALSEAMARQMSFFQFPRQSYIRNFQARATDAKTAAAKAASATTPASDTLTATPQNAVSTASVVP
jgi:protein tyrosine/serine phosphatase